VAHDVKKWLRPLARAGYAARGLIYGVIGFFAALAAVGAGRTMGSRDALSVLFSGTGGSIMAYILIAGLAFYSLWRFIQAGYDTDSHGTGAKGLAIRGALVVSGISYGILASYSLSLARGAGGDSGGGEGGWAETLAGFVGASWVAAALAVALAGAGVAHVIKAIKKRYARYITADDDTMRFIHPIARTGLIARGTVFLVLAFLLATRSVRGGEQASSKAALEFVQGLPLGWLLLSLMGIGLIAFAAYSFAEAIYRRVDLEDVPV
jgi:hypothetical protein